MIFLSQILRQFLTENLTYNQLFNASSLKRKKRARGMKVERINVASSSDNKSWNFSYKSASNNNSTGNTWTGRITFLKDIAQKNADDLPCTVDCSCPDYKFRYAYSNHKKNASPIGSNSLNQCNGLPPDSRNPDQIIGMCKHLVSLKNDLHTKVGSTQSKTASDKLNEVVRRYKTFDVDYTED